MRITRTVKTTKSLQDVFAYMSDFTSTNDWDPATVKTTLISGDGGVGSRYKNITEFNGRQTELEYVVTDFVDNKVVKLRGENKTLVAVDTMLFSEQDGTVYVTYDANFTFKGFAKLAEPFLKKAFKKLGDDAEVGLKKALS
jgi:hypothetical protein